MRRLEAPEAQSRGGHCFRPGSPKLTRRREVVFARSVPACLRGEVAVVQPLLRADRSCARRGVSSLDTLFKNRTLFMSHKQAESPGEKAAKQAQEFPKHEHCGPDRHP
jgi:hypothetical protein